MEKIKKMEMKKDCKEDMREIKTELKGIVNETKMK